MRFLITLLILLVPVQSFGVTAADLLDKLRRVTGQAHSARSAFTDSSGLIFLDMAQDNIIALSGYLHKTQDIIHDESTDYTLNTDFVRLKGVVVKAANDNYNWKPMFPNPYFAADTNVINGYVDWQDPDTARLYIRGPLWLDDTIRVSYLATANALDSTTITCEVPKRLQTQLIEEAIRFYLYSGNRFGEASTKWQQLRTDMGLLQRQ
jgi:hypothetical protein